MAWYGMHQIRDSPDRHSNECHCIHWEADSRSVHKLPCYAHHGWGEEKWERSNEIGHSERTDDSTTLDWAACASVGAARRVTGSNGGNFPT